MSQVPQSRGHPRIANSLSKMIALFVPISNIELCHPGKKNVQGFSRKHHELHASYEGG